MRKNESRIRSKDWTDKKKCVRRWCQRRLRRRCRQWTALAAQTTTQQIYSKWAPFIRTKYLCTTRFNYIEIFGNIKIEEVNCWCWRWLTVVDMPIWLCKSVTVPSSLKVWGVFGLRWRDQCVCVCVFILCVAINVFLFVCLHGIILKPQYFEYVVTGLHRYICQFHRIFQYEVWLYAAHTHTHTKNTDLMRNPNPAIRIWEDVIV